ncbi:histidine phosphatase superfamily [Nemania abortiva]|nr:histidine phosphatase superfamily [Nemania abortiva]
MDPIIDIVRVAQGRNHLEGHDIPDPGLTPEGKEQCATLRETYPYMSQVKLIVSSPLRRAIDTAKAFLPDDSPRVPQTQIVLLPGLQATSLRPSDTGSPESALQWEFGTAIDTSRLEGEDWYVKDRPESLETIGQRARRVRLFLRRCARKLKDGDRIVVVTHGAFAHFLVQDFGGPYIGQESGVWSNAEFRSFEFDAPQELNLGIPLREI